MLSSRYAKMLCRLAEHPYILSCRQGSTTLDSVVYNDTTVLAKKQLYNTDTAKVVWFYHFLTQRKGCSFVIRAAPVLGFSPSPRNGYSLIQRPNFNPPLTAEKRWLPGQPKLPYHQPGTPRNGERPAAFHACSRAVFIPHEYYRHTGIGGHSGHDRS